MEKRELIETRGKTKIYMIHTYCDLCGEEILGNHAEFKETWDFEHSGEYTWDICKYCSGPFNKLIRSQKKKNLTKRKK